MADSMRQKIVAAVKARLAEISVANGYKTNAGATVKHGWRAPAKGDAMPRVALRTGELPEPDELSQDEVIVRKRWSIEILGLAQVAADDEEPLDAAEDLLDDIKRAVFDDDDRTLGGLLRPNREVGDVEIGAEAVIDRDEGGSYVGCYVMALITFTEQYGAPEAA